MSQTTFSRLTGIKQSAYSNYERGTREIPLTTAVKIAEKLSIDLAWLLIGVPGDTVARVADDPPAAHDPRLAEMLVWLSGEWAAHNEHGRAQLRRRFETAFSEWQKTIGDDGVADDEC